MKSVYTPLPNYPHDEQEAKPLVDSPELESASEDALPSDVYIPSINAKVFVYALCTVALLFSLANLAVAVDLRGKLGVEGYHRALDTLPRRDIFVGLPNRSQVHITENPNQHQHEHAHEHEHEHEHEHST